MRRVLLLAWTAALALAAPAPSGSVGRMQVVANEYRFTLSRTKIEKGQTMIELANFGMDPHDLQIQDQKGGRTYTTGVVAPGTRRTVTVKLAAGRYRLWCSLLDHQTLGMSTVVTVK